MKIEHEPEFEQEEEVYSFLQEEIKEEKHSKRMFYKVLKWSGLGIAFGISACVGFFALKPLAETAFQKEPTKVELPQNPETEDKTQQEVQANEKDVLKIEDYHRLNATLNHVAAEAKKSVVNIRSTSSEGSGSGVIVADNGRELLILARDAEFMHKKELRVRFVNNAQIRATLKEWCGNTGLAVIAVEKQDVSDELIKAIAIAELGNSNALGQGRTLIALGQPFGAYDGQGYGSVSSVNESVILADGTYGMILTDMPWTANGSGVLFDAYGKVQGLIAPELAKENGYNIMAACGISDVIVEAELMLNGNQVPYVGIIGTGISEEVGEKQGIPSGLYVQEVEADSPAMQAGIQSGDVITSVDGKEVTSLKGYRVNLNKQKVDDMIIFKGKRQGADGYVDIKFEVIVGVKK